MFRGYAEAPYLQAFFHGEEPGRVALVGDSQDYGRSLSVGASLLAKNSQAPRLFRKLALSLRCFASKLAPTVVLMQIPW
ncbi:hypothetical protein C7A12_00230 [Pseudomonas fluorescens]|nr:hypothetical protein C7A12_00230 [Pseudomonas fluorescens]PRW82393.1 hypothetical protein C7A13_00230 [Pseudomonas fluorescens]